MTRADVSGMSRDRPLRDAMTPVIVAPESLNDAFCDLWSISLARAPRCASILAGDGRSVVAVRALAERDPGSDCCRGNRPRLLAFDDRDVGATRRPRRAQLGLGGRDFRLDRRQLQRDADFAWCVDAGQLASSVPSRPHGPRSCPRLRRRLRSPARQLTDADCGMTLNRADSAGRGERGAPCRTGGGAMSTPRTAVRASRMIRSTVLRSDRPPSLAHEGPDVRRRLTSEYSITISTSPLVRTARPSAHRGERRLEPARSPRQASGGELDATDGTPGRTARVGAIERVEPPDPDDQATNTSGGTRRRSASARWPRAASQAPGRRRGRRTARNQS